jgi:hypothetical protein
VFRACCTSTGPDAAKKSSERRFTRLTNAFSKKLENHTAMVALYFMFYNFGRLHQARVTPAMEARLTDHMWSLEKLVSLLDRRSAVAA